jgi:pyruvate ferredoxin oxidoreductase alpha subunit
LTRTLLTGNAAAAWGARLARAEYFPAFPITPQTEIVETLAAWIERDELDGRLVVLESEHSMLTAAAAAAATGVRVFTSTSSQGLLYGMEMIYTAAGWRAPFVLVNVSRGLASPLTLESDHSDVLAARDSGFLQIHCASCQEVVDTVLMAYRLAEHPEVRLPVIVNLDGFHLSFTREPIQLPDADDAELFLPAFDPAGIEFRASRPISQAVAVLGGTPYSYFRYQTHLAALRAASAYDEIALEFASRFGRHHPAVESYRADDAELVFFMIGALAGKAKDAVDRLRERGIAVGLVRPRLLRPYPREALRRALAGRRAVAVIDQNLSMGQGGVLHAELAEALYGEADPPLLVSFIAGLGGRDLPAEELYAIVEETRRAADAGRAPEPRLVYTQAELREVRALQAIAAVESHEVGAEHGRRADS